MLLKTSFESRSFAAKTDFLAIKCISGALTALQSIGWRQINLIAVPSHLPLPTEADWDAVARQQAAVDEVLYQAIVRLETELNQKEKEEAQETEIEVKNSGNGFWGLEKFFFIALPMLCAFYIYPKSNCVPILSITIKNSHMWNQSQLILQKRKDPKGSPLS